MNPISYTFILLLLLMSFHVLNLKIREHIVYMSKRVSDVFNPTLKIETL